MKKLSLAIDSPAQRQDSNGGQFYDDGSDMIGEED